MYRAIVAATSGIDRVCLLLPIANGHKKIDAHFEQAEVCKNTCSRSAAGDPILKPNIANIDCPIFNFFPD